MNTDRKQKNSAKEKGGKFVSADELARQEEFCSLVKEYFTERKAAAPKAFVHTYGCQQNVSDGEHIKGMLQKMGYTISDSADDADAVIFVTCAVREHAEDRVFGNVGALKKLKAVKPKSIIALCGCMVQQPHIAEKLRKSYPYVDLIFGTHVLHRLPEFIYSVLINRIKTIVIPSSDGVIAEGLPAVRDSSFKAFIPIMYGCNNFCTYCIVPYVRGRERSRKKDDIIAEAKALISSGCKEITLLGQNVNSYGKDLETPVGFARLLAEIAELEGDFTVRFMTSHPKDCTDELLQVMSTHEKVAKHLHLPVQSGSDRILKLMNRHYTRENYLKRVEKARSLMPDLSITSDIIVGFPGEEYEDFLETVSLIKQVGYTSLFTFIYSPREGTPAAKMDDPIPDSDKKKWFAELLKVQEASSAERCSNMLGTVQRVLCEGERTPGGALQGRTEGNIIVEFEGDPSLTGQFINVEITSAKSWVLGGKIISE